MLAAAVPVLGLVLAVLAFFVGIGSVAAVGLLGGVL
jgi:hypothetical protein